MSKEIINFEVLKKRHEQILEDINNILSGYQAVVGAGKQKVIYTSVPISTGIALYNALKKYKCKSKAELKLKNIKAYNQEVRDINVKDGKKFAEDLRTKNKKIVISPADFKEQAWQDIQYMAYWELVIDQFIDEIHFNNDYHYSSGCVEELLIGVVKNKKLFHRDGKPLVLSEEIPKLWAAAEKITNVCNEEPKNLINFIIKIELYHRNRNKQE